MFFDCIFAMQLWALAGVDIMERPMQNALLWIIEKSIQLGCLEPNLYIGWLLWCNKNKCYHHNLRMFYVIFTL